MNVTYSESAPSEKLVNPIKSHDPTEGPLCDRAEWLGYCGHESCGRIIQDTPEYAMCEKHGHTMVTAWGSGTGYAGGSIYWFTMSCGCTYMDEDDDVRAAY